MEAFNSTIGEGGVGVVMRDALANLQRAEPFPIRNATATDTVEALGFRWQRTVAGWSIFWKGMLRALLRCCEEGWIIIYIHL